jgi:uncharacterized membrane protein (UPF0127 family)
MLFEYAHAFPRHFWMRNCRIPMDLAYINEGRIQQLETMPAAYGADPHLLPRFDSDMSIKFALEMEAGWFQKNGVKVGDLVQFE